MLVACRRMDDDSSRLVDDEQVLVLVWDPELPRLRLGVGVDLFWNLDLEPLTALEPVALRPQLTVNLDGANPEQTLRLGPRSDLGQRS